MAAVVPPIVPEVQALSRSRPGTLSLAQGMVWFTPPEALVRETLAASFTADAHYGPVFGDEALIETYAARLVAHHGYAADGLAARLAATAGANMGFQQAVLTISRPGDRVVLFEPFYFNHEMALKIAGLEPVVVPSDGDEDRQLEMLASAIDARTRAVVTVSPNNPTGTVMAPTLLERINRLCADAGIYHISDEAYDELVFEGRHLAPAALPGAAAHTIALYSLSKSFGFAGWRLGFTVLPAALVDDFRKVQDTNLICPTRLTQRLATRLIRDWDEPRRVLIAALDAQRRRMVERLARACPRVQVAGGEGALYLWVRLPEGHHGDAACRELIAREGVATLPGSAFARPGAADRYLRLSFGGITGADFDAAVERLGHGLARITGT